ncbi:3-phosphoshikimate 1-carboxyvinyltransferase [Cetobacterium sp. SF1]|uniref:3-phosphoshikimate 1-carboxyvinyltransferase n=1 Tax=unclassified Cetobacterium TaxID=2630983 RepID=UPI003CF67589
MTNNYREIKPIKNFKSTVNIPGSKSISNRALILAALGKNKIILKNMLFSDDTIYMIEGLKKLGVKINLLENKTDLEIIPPKNLQFNSTEIYIGNAGTAMRFLASYISAGKGEVILTGNSRMKERPISDLVEALKALDVDVEYVEKIGYPPIKIISNGINKDFVEIDCSKSSQYLSSLLLSASYFKKSLTIKVKNQIVSKPYVDMTIQMIKDFGGNIKFSPLDKTYTIVPKEYNLKEYTIEGDMSSASYFLGAALIGSGEITLKNFFKNSLQGDREFLNILKQLGLIILEEKEKEITVKGIETYPGIEINLNDTPDIAQTLAIVSLFSTTPSKITDVENMRIKETDRITALNNEITKLGGNFTEFKDGFEIIPQEHYHGDFIETYDDHRMAMSFAIAGLRIPNIKILNPQCVNKTFPTFFQELEKLY